MLLTLYPLSFPSPTHESTAGLEEQDSRAVPKLIRISRTIYERGNKHFETPHNVRCLSSASHMLKAGRQATPTATTPLRERPSKHQENTCHNMLGRDPPATRGFRNLSLGKAKDTRSRHSPKTLW